MQFVNPRTTRKGTSPCPCPKNLTKISFPQSLRANKHRRSCLVKDFAYALHVIVMPMGGHNELKRSADIHAQGFEVVQCGGTL